MTAAERVPRIRRTYNRWVANQTLEDYALRFTAHEVRRFSPGRIANTAIGAISFLALEAIGGAITLNYGFANASSAILVACAVMLLIGIPIAYNAARYGVDIDLLTRGAGFGYLGSTITSLVYACFTFLFFAIEAAIVAKMLELVTGLPLTIGYIVSAVAIIPLVTHGVSFISRFQAWTQPFWVVLQLAPFLFIAAQGLEPVRSWTGYTGLLGRVDNRFDITLFGLCSAVVFSLAAQIGEQVDYLRFLPKRNAENRWRWWIALISSGPGWVVIGAAKIFAGSFLAYYAFRNGVPFSEASDPTQMYLTVFLQMLQTPELALGVTGVFVVICQVKINVTNSYAGSIAWSNFFSRLTHSHPGRVVWLVFNVLIGLLLMEFGIYKALEAVLGLYSIVAIAWTASIAADLMIAKPLKLSPQMIEFKRAHLFDINPVGVGAMAVAILAAFAAYSGLMGEILRKIYIFVALLAPFLLVPLIAWATGGRYYIARTSHIAGDRNGHAGCTICELKLDREDMASCPVYAGAICSLCCSLDARCQDACKTNARLGQQARRAAERLLPTRLVSAVPASVMRYLALFAVVNAAMGGVFWLIHFQTSIESPAISQLIAFELWKLYVILFILAGIVTWLFVLAQESRDLAEEEARRHTRLLMDEIKAHEETDRQLQKAKEAAESANLAKSKYVVGLSHELRTPLTAILGYAQILERVQGAPAVVHNAARTIKRSGEHLADMIEGLLDISKIEAGRLEIFRHKIALGPFLDQIVDMFTLQAKAKGIEFEFHAAKPIPDYVFTDEKRLRQVLINLLSNAIKFTHRGRVRFSLRYRSQVATFRVEDTGIGIRPDDIERIFLPFERAEHPADQPQPPGTGLGLTITKLLVEIMGGELSLKSRYGKGTTSTVRLMLSQAARPEDKVGTAVAIVGYEGRRRRILVADDDATQRRLMEEVLTPLGFSVIAVDDGPACLSSLALNRPDLIILDLGMPTMSGWEVARRIRQRHGRDLPILILSADAGHERTKPDYAGLFDSYLIKPFGFDELFERLAALIPLSWIREDGTGTEGVPPPVFGTAERPADAQLGQLKTLAELGFVRSIEAMLADIELTAPHTQRFCHHLRHLATSHRLREMVALIEDAKDHA